MNSPNGELLENNPKLLFAMFFCPYRKQSVCISPGDISFISYENGDTALHFMCECGEQHSVKL
jgi:hypothetical protein